MLDRSVIDSALRRLIATDIDYDTHKSIERDETSGEDSYPDLVEKFIQYLEEAEND